MDGQASGQAKRGVSLDDEDDDEARSPNRCFCLSLSCFCTFLIFADVSGARQASLASSDDAAARDFGMGGVVVAAQTPRATTTTMPVCLTVVSV